MSFKNCFNIHFYLIFIIYLYLPLYITWGRAKYSFFHISNRYNYHLLHWLLYHKTGNHVCGGLFLHIICCFGPIAFPFTYTTLSSYYDIIVMIDIILLLLAVTSMNMHSYRLRTIDLYRIFWIKVTSVHINVLFVCFFRERTEWVLGGKREREREP